MNEEIISIGSDRTLWKDNCSKLQLANAEGKRLDWNYSYKQLIPSNLGVYYEANSPECYCTTGLIGIMPVLWQGETSPDYSKILAVCSRWGNPMQMLDVVLRSHDYFDNETVVEPIFRTWNEWRQEDLNKKGAEILCGLVSDLPEICISGNAGNTQLKSLADVSCIFIVYQFLAQLERICKRSVKQISLAYEENLVGKMKGKILIHKQIKENLSKGKIDRVYCCYNKMSLDNSENRILKYALYLCKIWSNERGGVFGDKIVFCDDVLKPVKLIKVTRRDIISVKNNGAFKEYKKGIKLAGDILRKMSIEFKNGQQPAVSINTVTPFFLNMNLLFELYCRALLENTDLTMDSKKNRSRCLFKKYGHHPKNFQNEHILDMLMYGKNYKLVLDAKYSLGSVQNPVFRREYTHQVLSYMLIWNTDDCGFIYPIYGTEPNVILVVSREKMDGIIDGKDRYALTIGINEDSKPEKVADKIKDVLKKILENKNIEWSEKTW